jgi:hypothetical protein
LVAPAPGKLLAALAPLSIAVAFDFRAAPSAAASCDDLLEAGGSRAAAAAVAVLAALVPFLRLSLAAAPISAAAAARTTSDDATGQAGEAGAGAGAAAAGALGSEGGGGAAAAVGACTGAGVVTRAAPASLSLFRVDEKELGDPCESATLDSGSTGTAISGPTAGAGAASICFFWDAAEGAG